MPPDLDIDRSSPLDGTMPAYRHHVLVRTGVTDWPSKVEDDARFPLVQTMRQRFGRHGKFHDPFNHTILSTSSHPASSPSILLFPSFKAISSDSALSSDGFDSIGDRADALIETHLFSPVTGGTTTSHRAKELSNFKSRSIEHLTILICGHSARDSRCGLIGPLLEQEFGTYLKRQQWTVDATGSSDLSDTSGKSSEPNGKMATVEQISHVGGHKFAGNVILYVPSAGLWADHPLAAKGIWYGRVEPSHVPGIVEETIGKGVIIKELFRGGITGNGEIIRL